MTYEQLLREIEDAASEMGLAPSTLCRKAINRGNVPKLLRSGRGVTLLTATRLRSWISTQAGRGQNAIETGSVKPN